MGKIILALEFLFNLNLVIGFSISIIKYLGFVQVLNWSFYHFIVKVNVFYLPHVSHLTPQAACQHPISMLASMSMSKLPVFPLMLQIQNIRMIQS
jgi:hypothetical protein